MEPVAPGTEDEHIDFNFVTKKETETERLLSQKAFLRNGQYENVFELSYLNGTEHWFCKVCECPVMGRTYQHEIGRRHNNNLQMSNRHVEKDNPPNKLEQPDETIELEIAPGEPVPPGFEGEIRREAQIQERLDGFKVGPLVALEYLIEMVDYDVTKEPCYLCILCDKKGDPRTVLTHLASYNHISQYLQKHFPTCYRALAPYMVKQYKRNWQVVLQKIAEAIEKKFGRLRPFCIEAEKFERDRMQYLTMISRGKHFSEQLGTTFVELVVHDELTKVFDEEGKPLKLGSTWGGKPFIEKPFQKRSPSPPVVARPTKKPRTPADDAKASTTKNAVSRRRSLSSVSSISSDEEQDKKGFRKMARNRSPPPRGERRQERAFRRRSPSPLQRKFDRDPKRSAKEEEERRRNREKERQEKLEEFKKLSKAIENDMAKTMKNYEKNPEKHPKYNEEWKMFWNRRYKELQGAGKDPSKHDFKPEWIQYWGKKMQELQNEELKTRKEGLRKRLGIPEEVTPISFRIGGGTGVVSKATPKPAPTPREVNVRVPMAARPDNDPEIIVLDDKDDVQKDTSRDRSHSPWERESPPNLSARFPNTKFKRVSPISGKTPREKVKSRERSVEVKKSVERRKSPLERRKSPFERRKSPIERRKSPIRPRRSRSREKSWKSPVRGLSRDKRSRSPDTYRSSKRSWEKELRDKEFVRERDLRERDRERSRYSIERSYERFRESSFERDMRERDRIRTVADLPWAREKALAGYSRPLPEYDDYYGHPHKMRDVSWKPQLNFVPPPGPMVDEEPDDGEVNIVSVLRLLTALEDRLGSLGPKVIDLLAQALAMEKKEANSSDALLDNEINCVMFETVKEKLKGQLLAGLVDPVQERAFKKAIQKTARLIHIGSQRKREREEQATKKTDVAVPGVGAVDKAAIAKQLANALVAQGKTNVTQAELEQLINAVVGMAEASKAANKTVTAAAFLSQLSEEPPSSSEIPKEKIIIPRVRSMEKPKDSVVDLDKLTEPLSPSSTPEKSTTSNMENLSDSDLQTLLQNFKDLSTEEQMNLINYLKKLELDEPERVERLRKFVNLGPDKGSKDAVIDLDKEPDNQNGRESPFSARLKESNMENEDYNTKKDHKPVKINLDSEDEDYSFEDVVKAASNNVKQKEMEDNQKIVNDSIQFDSNKKEVNLTDAKTIISNLMTSAANSSGVNLLGLPVSSSYTMSNSNNFLTATSSADFAKTLSSINIDSLTSIVNSVQRVNQNSEPKTLTFEPPPNQSPADRLKPGPRGPAPASAQPHFSPPPGVDNPVSNLPLRGMPPGFRGPAPMRMGPGPRGPPMGYPPRGPGTFGGPGGPMQRHQRPPFNAGYGNPRFGPPRGPAPGFNRW